MKIRGRPIWLEIPIFEVIMVRNPRNKCFHISEIDE
jgi:hypothetical protein